MRNLRTIRIFLATIFFVATLAYLFIGEGVHPLAPISKYSQIIPSALAATIGASIFWLIATFLLGRVYCSTVCPVGTLTDCGIWLRRKTSPQKKFRYRHPRKVRYNILFCYIACSVLLPGAAVVGFLIEPWHIMENIASVVNRNAVAGTWATLAFGVAGGITTGVITLIILIALSYFKGRFFCTTICPIGTAMGSLDGKTLMHIDINPDKCTNCFKCEEVCPSQCIKVVSRYVDNSRCIRCFDCLHVCDDDAIHYQINPNIRFNTPLLRKRTKI